MSSVITTIRTQIKQLGPGILFAGAAIGGSHLVQSTRAGAHYGLSLIGIVILINILKYPFFEYGQRYVAATGESILSGYRRLGKPTLITFLMLVILTSVFNIAAVVLITTGLAQNLFALGEDSKLWVSIGISLVSIIILFLGKYAFLEKTMKVMVFFLAITTVTAVIIASKGQHVLNEGFVQPEIWDKVGFGFIIALMGWMPAPIEVSVWPSLWSVEQNKNLKTKPKLKEVLWDFNVGYIGTAILAVFFLLLGYFLMHGTGLEFQSSSVLFTGQLVDMYVQTFGSWSFYVILVVVFFTMASTTLTVFDAFPRTIYSGLSLLSKNKKDLGMKVYWGITIILVSCGLLIIHLLPASGFKALIDFTTIVCFLTAPIFAWVNFRVVTASFMPEGFKPSSFLRILSYISIVFLSLLSIGYIISLMV